MDWSSIHPASFQRTTQSFGIETKSKTAVPRSLGHNVTEDNLYLKGSRLPANIDIDILKCMYAFVMFECKGKWTSVVNEAAEYVYDQALPVLS